MPTYVIGDVQGCFDSLQALLAKLDFDPEVDELWFTGDLVNRGPRNLDLLRFVRGLGDRAVAVLGNHDLHLLARAAEVSRAKRLDTLDDVLEADDRDELIDWLRRRPVVWRDGDDLLVHAGFRPEWSDGDIDELAAELSAGLAGDEWIEVLEVLKRERDGRLETATGLDRLAAISSVLQRVRTIDRDGSLASYSGSPEDAPAGCRPWFDIPSQRRASTRVFFGHWAALGLLVRDRYIGLDTGCVWGNRLTAFERETGRITSVKARERCQTGAGR